MKNIVLILSLCLSENVYAGKQIPQSLDERDVYSICLTCSHELDSCTNDLKEQSEIAKGVKKEWYQNDEVIVGAVFSALITGLLVGYKAR